MTIPPESNKLPSEFHPHLRPDRLQAIAGLIYAASHSAYRRHDPKFGDDRWSLGCVRFARCRNLILEKAKSGEWEWLGIVNDSKRLVFKVGEVPVRFCRGRVSNPPQRTLASWSDEVYQQSLAFPEDATLSKIIWRLVVETGYLGDPTKIVFAGYTDKRSVYCSWDIETPDEVMLLGSGNSGIPVGVQIDEPLVALKSSNAQDASPGK